MVAGSVDSETEQLRPIYVSCVFWGERFRDFFIDVFIPSLLSPGNLPAISEGRRNKVLIATTPEDYAIIEQTAQFRRMKQYAEPMLFPIPPAPPGVNGCQHMGVGHLQVTDQAFKDKAYLCALVPDMIISDGTLAFVEKKAREGYQAVLSTCIRVEEDGFLSGVRAAAGVDHLGKLGDTEAAIGLSGRQLVRISMDNLHSQGMTWNYDKPYFAQFPVAPFWPSAANNAWLFHSLHWVPLLLDYGCLEGHDQSCLKNWTMDGDYLHDNFTSVRSWIVQDSDDAYVTSWSPADDRPVPLTYPPEMDYPDVGPMLKGIYLNKTYGDPIFDKMKQTLFFVPIRWHVGETSEDEWLALENRVQALLKRWCGRDGDRLLNYVRAMAYKSALGRFLRILERVEHTQFVIVIFQRLGFLLECLEARDYEILKQKTKRRLRIIVGLEKP